MKETHYRTFTVSVPSGTAAGASVESDAKMPVGYKTVVGIASYFHGTAGSSTMRLGLKTSNGHIVQDVTHFRDWESDITQTHHDRYKPLGVEADGYTYVLVFSPTATLTAAQTFDIVFKLQK